mmetsp:Transcript_82493/g.172748  ORF Transcript_82493/g.172748 Transcript_82493/m.172748 type:complete len:502 (+) Transcript_82493:79-1584(+)
MLPGRQLRSAAFAACWLLCARQCWSYEKIHMVDLYQVVCASGYVDITLDEDQLNASKYYPHVVTFLRSGGSAVDIAFNVLGDGAAWSLGSQTVALMDTSDIATTTSITVTTTTMTTTMATDSSRRRASAATTTTTTDAGHRRRAATTTATTTTTDAGPRRRAATTTTEAAHRRRRVVRLLGTADDLKDGYDELDEELDEVMDRMAEDRPLVASPRRLDSSSSSSSTTTPRRRTYGLGVPAPRRRSSMTEHRRRTPPRRRATYVAPRRRGSTYSAVSDSTPRRRYFSAGGTRWTSPGTGGISYGYTSSSEWALTYPTIVSITSYGYTGGSAYGVSKTSTAVSVAAGFAGGTAVTASTYYLYRTLSSSTCTGYSCCYGCPSSCFTSSNHDCTIGVSDQLTQDDIMAAGFYPDELNFPVVIRITSIVGDDYTQASICAPSTCTNFTSCTTTSEANTLWVTLSQMEELGSIGVAGARPTANPFAGLVTMVCSFSMLFFLRAAIRR